MARRKTIDEPQFTAHKPDAGLHITGGSELAYRFSIYQALQAMRDTLALTGAMIASSRFDPPPLDEKEFGLGYEETLRGIHRMMATTQFPRYEDLARERGGLILDESAGGNC